MDLETSADGRSVGSLRRVARDQRWVIGVVLAQLALWAGYLLVSLTSSRALDTDPVVALTVLAGGVGAVFAFRLAHELRNGFAAMLFAMVAPVPVLGLLVLTLVNSDASNELRRHGIAVGVFGADPDAVDPAPALYDEDAVW